MNSKLKEYLKASTDYMTEAEEVVDKKTLKKPVCEEEDEDVEEMEDEEEDELSEEEDIDDDVLEEEDEINDDEESIEEDDEINDDEESIEEDEDDGSEDGEQIEESYLAKASRWM